MNTLALAPLHPDSEITVSLPGVEDSLAVPLMTALTSAGFDVVTASDEAPATVSLQDMASLRSHRVGLVSSVAVLLDPADAEDALLLGAVDFVVWPRDRDILAVRVRVAASRATRKALPLDVVACLPDRFFRSSADGIFLECYPNTGFLLPPEEFIGRHYADVLPDPVAASFRTGYVALSAGAPYVQLRYSIPEGALMQPYEARMFRDGAGQILTVARAAPPFAPLGLTDNTEDGLFRSVFDAAAIGISVAGRGGALIETNAAFREMLGYSEEEVRGRHYLEFCHPEDADLDATQRRELHEGVRDSYRIAKRYLTKAGDTVWTQLTVSVLRNPDGTIRAGIGMLEDRSERRRASQALLATQKMEAVGHLAGGIAHDFNNLLVAVISNIDFALEVIESGQTRRDLEDAKRAAEHGAVLTQQLLTFSRRQVLVAEPLSLNTVIAGIMRMLRRAVGQHVRFVFRPGPELGTVLADRGQLEQLLVNLCVNARDAMPDGGRLTLSTFNTELATGNPSDLPRGEYVVLEVTDTGTGIPAEILPHIFDPFFTTKEGGRGTGLGLPMVYGLVQQHGGAVDVETVPDEGTRFSVFLPRTSGAPRRVRVQTDSSELKPALRGTGTILLAEDNPQVREITVRVLEDGGYTVLTASDGLEACDVFEDQADRVDLVLLDVMMPRMSGRKAYERMREHRPEARFAFFSGYSTETLDSDFVAAHRILAKPFRREGLLSFVASAMRATRP